MGLARDGGVCACAFATVSLARAVSFCFLLSVCSCTFLAAHLSQADCLLSPPPRANPPVIAFPPHHVVCVVRTQSSPHGHGDVKPPSLFDDRVHGAGARTLAPGGEAPDIRARQQQGDDRGHIVFALLSDPSTPGPRYCRNMIRSPRVGVASAPNSEWSGASSDTLRRVENGYLTRESPTRLDRIAVWQSEDVFVVFALSRTYISFNTRNETDRKSVV